MLFIYLVTAKAAAEWELLFNKPASGLVFYHGIRLERLARGQTH